MSQLDEIMHLISPKSLHRERKLKEREALRKLWGLRFDGRMRGGNRLGGQSDCLNGSRSEGPIDDLSGGSYWIANALKKTKRGAFSAKARHAGMSTRGYACKIVRSPSADLTTRREAQMFINMNRSRRC